MTLIEIDNNNDSYDSINSEMKKNENQKEDTSFEIYDKFEMNMKCIEKCNDININLDMKTKPIKTLENNNSYFRGLVDVEAFAKNEKERIKNENEKKETESKKLALNNISSSSNR